MHAVLLIHQQIIQQPLPLPLPAAAQVPQRPERGTTSQKRFLSWQCRHLTKEGQFGECHRLPIFGPYGSRTGLFCKRHKRATDVDVRNAMCRYLHGCTRRPTHALVLIDINGKRKCGPAQLCRNHAPQSYEPVHRPRPKCALAGLLFF